MERSQAQLAVAVLWAELQAQADAPGGAGAALDLPPRLTDAQWLWARARVLADVCAAGELPAAVAMHALDALAQALAFATRDAAGAPRPDSGEDAPAAATPTEKRRPPRYDQAVGRHMASLVAKWARARASPDEPGGVVEN